MNKMMMIGPVIILILFLCKALWWMISGLFLFVADEMAWVITAMIFCAVLSVAGMVYRRVGRG